MRQRKSRFVLKSFTRDGFGQRTLVRPLLCDNPKSLKVGRVIQCTLESLDRRQLVVDRRAQMPPAGMSHIVVGGRCE
jgi:hypothetical protein